MKMSKNKKEEMPNIVCESLMEFNMINESFSEALEIFRKNGFRENSEEWISFRDAFSDDPELMGKVANWIKFGDPDSLEDVIEAYGDSKEYDINPNKFQSLRDFKKKVKEEKTKERDELRKRNQELEQENKDIDDFIQNNNKLIVKLNLKRVFTDKNRGLYASQNVNSSQLFKRGQGLYIWTDLPYLYKWDGDPNKLKTNFKFGQYGAFAGVQHNLEDKISSEEQMAGKIPGETIAGYSGIYNSPKVILYVKNLDEYLSEPDCPYKNAKEVEDAIGKSLRKKRWSNPVYLKSTEVFRGGTLKELEEIINKVITGSHKPQVVPREEQREGISKIANYFLNKPGKNEFLLAAKMRYGKNITILKAIKDLNEKTDQYRNILFLTYKPAVFSSLKEDIEKFSDFSDFEIVEVNKEKNIPTKSKKVRIFISSAQYALYGDNEEKKDLNESKKEELYKLDPDEEVKTLQQSAYSDYEKNIDKIKNIDFGLIVADEYHYGTKSSRFRKLLQSLKYKDIIWVSGTAMKDLATGKFGNNQVYNWTYIDEQKKKNEERELAKENPDGDYPHLDMPTMNFVKMNLGEDAKRLAADRGLYSEDQGFSFTKFIDVDDKGNLENEEYARDLLRRIINPQYGGMASIYGAKAKGVNLDHTFWVLAKNTNGIKALAKLMRSMPEFRDYEIIEATGGLNNDIDKVKNKITDAENSGKKSITMSCYRFKEGTTVPQWGGVVMLDDGESAEEYLQAIFRAQSPDKEKGKDNCYVFDYNPRRALSIYHDIAQWSSKDGTESQSQLLKDFMNYAPIFYSDGNNLVPVEAEEIMNHFRTYGNFSEKMSNDRVFNYDELENARDEDLMEMLRDISAKKNATKIVINDQDLKKAKNAIVKRIQKENPDIDKDEAEKQADLEILKEKIRNVLRTIPTFLIATEAAEKTIYEIIETEDPILFKEITGVEPIFLKILIDNKIIIPKVINQTIEYISESIEGLKVQPTLEGTEDFIKRNLVMAGEETSTPNSIVNEILDKLPEEIWSDSDATFCDPVCGTGKFLMGILERLMKGLESEFPDEEERRSHIIENQIYGVDNIKYKTIIAKTLLGTKGLKHHIINKDSLKLNWNSMPNFDVVIGNPPYKGTLHLDFLEKAYDISNEWVIFVQPSIWIIDEKNIYHRYKNMKALIKSHVKEITLFNGNPIFNTGLFFPFMISVLNKKEVFDKVEVNDEINNTKLFHESLDTINKWGDNKIYPYLKDKIMKLCNHDNLLNHKNEDNGKYIVNLSMIIADKNTKDVNKMYNKGHFILIPKGYEISSKKEKEGTKDAFWFSFKTRNEAQNFLDFIKTDWARFCLSIYKTNQHLNRGELKSVPWLDWSQPWPEEEFEKLIHATPEEIAFVKENIPDYYGIAKED